MMWVREGWRRRALGGVPIGCAVLRMDGGRRVRELCSRKQSGALRSERSRPARRLEHALDARYDRSERQYDRQRV